MEFPSGGACEFYLKQGAVLLNFSMFVLCLLFSTFGFAANEISSDASANQTSNQTTNHWTSAYQLTPTQTQLILRWENEQKFDHAKLVGFAISFQKHNLKPKPYVPEHTYWELMEVASWASGAAFSVFAEFAGFTFDNIAYDAACPNKVLFNFGYATGREYFQIDVLEQYMSTFNSLQITYAMHPETFAQKYWELAKARGFDIYLSTPNELAENIY